MSNHGVSCIGRMGGGYGDWFATLDFDGREATVYERAEGGNIPIARVPLGEVWPEDDEYDAELMDDLQNRRLMRIVFAPEIAASLVNVASDAEALREKLIEVLKAEPKADADTLRDAVWDAISALCDIANECDIAIDMLKVPEPDNPRHAEAAKGSE